LIELIRGVFPYPRPGTFIEMVENLMNSQPPQLPNNGLYSIELVDFISRCMQINPENRATINELLAHPWVRKYEGSSIDLLGWLRGVLM